MLCDDAKSDGELCYAGMLHKAGISVDFRLPVFNQHIQLNSIFTDSVWKQCALIGVHYLAIKSYKARGLPLEYVNNNIRLLYGPQKA